MRTTAALILGLVLGAIAHHGWVRLGQIEAELRAAEHDLADRD